MTDDEKRKELLDWEWAKMNEERKEKQKVEKDKQDMESAESGCAAIVVGLLALAWFLSWLEVV